MGHHNLWGQSLWEQDSAGAEVQVRWVPSHLQGQGNTSADPLAECGREPHPNHEQAPVHVAGVGGAGGLKKGAFRMDASDTHRRLGPAWVAPRGGAAGPGPCMQHPPPRF